MTMLSTYRTQRVQTPGAPHDTRRVRWDWRTCRCCAMRWSLGPVTGIPGRDALSVALVPMPFASLVRRWLEAAGFLWWALAKYTPNGYIAPVPRWGMR